MTLDDVVGLAGAFLARYLPMAIVLAPLGYLVWRWVQRRREEMRRHAEAGTIGPALFVQGEAMPIHFELLAKVGTGGGAVQSLHERVLRPSLGVRLLILTISALVLGQFFWPGLAPEGLDEAMEELPVSPIVIETLVLIAVVYGNFYIFSYEARYDTAVLIVSRLVFFRREYLWKNLERIGDDGRYDLVLFFRPGGKAKVLRHSKGINDFKVFALQKLQENKAANARTARG